jgi:DNA repair photolyase
VATELRWDLADAERPQGALFDEPVFEREPGRGEFRGLEFLHVRARSIINEVKGAGGYLPFRYTINAYRGCTHACTMCFARPTHTYLGMDAGDDFETKIVVKVNAVSLLRRELDPRRWAGDHIAMGTNTDPYQRCEGKYRLTRGIIEVLNEHANPFSILTKSTLVLRDLDLLVDAARRADVRVNLSVGTLDEHVWRTTEPGAPHPRQRLKAVKQLNEAGVPCGVLVAAVLPGLSDRTEQLEEVAKAAVDAGAVSVSTVLLHLRPGVKEVYLERLARTEPGLAAATARRYGDRSRLGQAEQARVADVVRGAVQRAGGCAAEPRSARHLNGREAEVPATPAAPAPPSAEQLGLGL